MDYEILTTFIGATLVLAITPGPDNIYVFTQSISNGRRSGLATTAGLISGCLVHTTLLAFGVSAVLKANNRLFVFIKVFGACYLIYLAWQTIRSKMTLPLTKDATSDKNFVRLFRQGFLMNVLNPKVTLFFIAFFPAFLFSNTMSPLLQFYVLGLLFMLVSAITFGSIAMLAGSISDRLAGKVGIGSYVKWFQVVVLLSIAAYLLFSN